MSAPPPQPMPPPLQRKPMLSPMLMSALVYPGTGQLVQRRWWSGGLFILTFSASFVWFIVCILKVMEAYYDFAFHPMTATGQAPSAAAMMTPFVITLAIYIVNVVDTALGNRLFSAR